ncbi:hypothetical protein V8E36_007259, partial [Tilletia maclaganii]
IRRRLRESLLILSFSIFLRSSDALEAYLPPSHCPLASPKLHDWAVMDPHKNSQFYALSPICLGKLKVYLELDRGSTSNTIQKGERALQTARTAKDYEHETAQVTRREGHSSI